MLNTSCSKNNENEIDEKNKFHNIYIGAKTRLKIVPEILNSRNRIQRNDY